MVISTASLMAAALGISCIYRISYMATRMIAMATRFRREYFQPMAYFEMYSSSSGLCSYTPFTSLEIYSRCFSLGNSA